MIVCITSLVSLSSNKPLSLGTTVTLAHHSIGLRFGSRAAEIQQKALVASGSERKTLASNVEKPFLSKRF